MDESNHEIVDDSSENSFCESCGMPLDKDSISQLDNRYCIHCQNQATGELSSYDQVRSGSINAAISLLGKTPEEATLMADKMMPSLPRWKGGMRN